VAGLPAAAVEEVFASAPSTQHAMSELAGEGLPLVDLLVQAQVAKSKREARELLSTGGVSINGERVSVDDKLGAGRLLHGKIALIRRGRKTWHVARFS
jgi:tyrosyl-tRNA synthetase